jgi:DNA-binding XRE family transcriptional regulator
LKTFTIKKRMMHNLLVRKLIHKRICLGLTQEQFSRLINLNPEILSRVEAEKKLSEEEIILLLEKVEKFLPQMHFNDLID